MIEIGAPVDRWLEECRVPFQVYEDQDARFPTSNAWKFIALAEQKEGIDDFGLRVANDRIFDVWGLSTVAGVHASPTLLGGIDEFARGIRREYSGHRVMLTRGEGETVRIVCGKTYDVEVPGFTSTEWFAIWGVIAVVQLFAGPAWQPDTISLRSPRVVPPLAPALFPDTDIRRGQPLTYISFPKTMLALGPHSFGASVLSKLKGRSPNITPKEPPWDLAESLQLILESYLPGGCPTLEVAAEIAGLSERTLQRKLSEDGLDYRWLVERTRFDVATRMLRESDASSLDIAFATGYEDPSHFARAFRRIAGCSPRDYRRQHTI